MKFFDMTVAVTGEKEESLAAQGRLREGYHHLPLPGRLLSGRGYDDCKNTFRPRERPDSGAQIVGGKGVDKRIDDLANGVRFNLTCYDLQEMELSYAPPFSSAKDPVNMAGYVIQNVLEGRMRPFYVEDIDRIPESAIRLDVRTPEEFEKGRYPDLSTSLWTA